MTQFPPTCRFPAFALAAGALALAGCLGAAQAMERGRSRDGFVGRGPAFSDRLRPAEPGPAALTHSGVVRGYDGMAISRTPDPFEPRREILRVPGQRQF